MKSYTYTIFIVTLLLSSMQLNAHYLPEEFKQAIIDGNINAVEYFANISDRSGYFKSADLSDELETMMNRPTPLHYACCLGNPDIINMLLEKNFNANPNRWCTVTIGNSSTGGNLLMLLIDGINNVKQGQSMESDLLLGKLYSYAQSLVIATPILVENTPEAAQVVADILQKVCKCNDKTMLELLDNAGVNTATIGANGVAPLFSSSDPEVIEYIISRKGFFDSTNLFLGHSSQNGVRAQSLEELYQMMLWQVGRGNATAEAIQCIAEKTDSGLNFKLHGMTPLTFACGFKNPDVIKALIYAGANRSIEDDKGSDLHYLSTFINIDPRKEPDTYKKFKSMFEGKKSVYERDNFHIKPILHAYLGIEKESKEETKKTKKKQVAEVKAYKKQLPQYRQDNEKNLELGTIGVLSTIPEQQLEKLKPEALAALTVFLNSKERKFASNTKELCTDIQTTKAKAVKASITGKRSRDDRDGLVHGIAMREIGGGKKMRTFPKKSGKEEEALEGLVSLDSSRMSSNN